LDVESAGPRPGGTPRDGPAVDRCDVCGTEGRFERFQLREMLFGLRETFEYHRCPSCGVMRIGSVPDDLGRHYPPAYYAISAPPVVGPGNGRLRSAAERARNRAALFGTGRVPARLLRRWARPLPLEVRRAVPFVRRAALRTFSDRILDVGCGRVPGNLIALRELGFRRLTGVDPYLDEESDQEGIVLRRRSIHETRGRYRLVTMHHSFEHMPDPKEAMASAGRLLAPGGVLMIRTPVMGSWFWDTYGTSWWELDPPRHLYIHTVASLEHCARAAGLRLVDTVWDSSPVEIIASEQIARGIAWRESASWGENPPAGLDDATLAEYRATVTELNATGRAGRAAFFFRGSGPSRGHVRTGAVAQ
jgi:SAM-dependent methyltransferase